MGIWLQVFGAFFAVMSLSVMFNVPKRYVLYDGIAAAVGWFIYLVVMQEGMSEMIAMFFSSMAIALTSHIFARIFKAPVTTFLIPGMLPLVPGVGMYRIVYYLVIGNNKMSSHYLIQTLLLAGVLALGVFVIDSLFRFLYGK